MRDRSTEERLIRSACFASDLYLSSSLDAFESGRACRGAPDVIQRQRHGKNDRWLKQLFMVRHPVNTLGGEMETLVQLKWIYYD
jgi:hypothetical protein